MQALRDKAAEAIRANGFPTRKIEAWHYTDLALLARTGFAEALTPVDEDVVLPEAVAPSRAVLIDGRFRADLTNAPVRSLGAGSRPPRGCWAAWRAWTRCRWRR
ncbi:hypothetical protein ACFQU7_19575 [Pseudoroseomonas wenyumeiae]